MFQGLVNVPIEHHPTIGDSIPNRCLKVMFKIPKKGHLPTPVSVARWVAYSHDLAVSHLQVNMIDTACLPGTYQEQAHLNHMNLCQAKLTAL